MIIIDIVFTQDSQPEKPVQRASQADRAVHPDLDDTENAHARESFTRSLLKSIGKALAQLTGRAREGEL